MVKLLLRDDDGTVAEGGQLAGRERHQLDAGAGLVIERVIGCRHEPDGHSDDLPYVVEVWAAYAASSGRYEIDSVWTARAANGPPVTSERTSRIPLATLLRSLADRGVCRRAITPTELVPFDMPNGRLPRKLDDEAYREIGLVHRLHEVLGHRATTSTAEHFDVSRGTVYNWLAEARERGLLEPIWQYRSTPAHSAALSHL